MFSKKKRKEKKNFLKTKDMEVNDALTIFTYEFWNCFAKLSQKATQQWELYSQLKGKDYFEGTRWLSGKE